MKVNYEKQALSTDLTSGGYINLLENLTIGQVRLIHAALGLSGEVGEVTDMIKKSIMYNKDIDKEKILLECGDVLWYMNILLNHLGSDFETVMKMNINKLKKRYPNGFDKKDAIEQKDKK